MKEEDVDIEELKKLVEKIEKTRNHDDIYLSKLANYGGFSWHLYVTLSAQ